jgi:hypothetical protein
MWERLRVLQMKGVWIGFRAGNALRRMVEVSG